MQTKQKNIEKNFFTTKELVLTAMMTAIMAVCSWISVPADIPFTMQTFAVFCTLELIGGKKGTFSVLIYLLIGAVGVPVFSGMTGGIGIILGNTGGYMIGFVFIGLIYWASEQLPIRNFAIELITLLIGIAVMYAFGTAWFMLLYTKKMGAITLVQTLKLCVVPFIIPDLIKLMLALILTKRIKKYGIIQN